MDDPEYIPEAQPPIQAQESDCAQEPGKRTEQTVELVSAQEPAWTGTLPAISHEDAESNRRSFRHNLFLLLSLTLAAFTLTAWILVHVDSPFGAFSSGPQEIVRAQLRAVDRGDLRPAYDMFSPRYRGQVSFDVWHQLVVTHWRMFHAEVLRSGTPANSGPGVTLEIYLHGADDKDYRARFTVVHTEGRWWIDDVHWAEEPNERDLTRT